VTPLPFRFPHPNLEAPKRLSTQGPASGHRRRNDSLLGLSQDAEGGLLSRVSGTRGLCAHAAARADLSRSWVILQSLSGTVSARLAFADSPSAFSVQPEGRSLAPGVFPPPPWSSLQTQTRHIHLSWTYPLPQSLHPQGLPSVRSVRRPCILPGSPHEVSGPFSTSSREDSPTRASTPAVFRLRRFRGPDGFLPSRPCRLVSSGGTRGVPGQTFDDSAAPEGTVEATQPAQCSVFLLQPARVRSKPDSVAAAAAPSTQSVRPEGQSSRSQGRADTETPEGAPAGAMKDKAPSL